MVVKVLPPFFFVIFEAGLLIKFLEEFRKVESVFSLIYNKQAVLRGRLMAGQRPLEPLVEVRVLPPQKFFDLNQEGPNFVVLCWGG